MTEAVTDDVLRVHAPGSAEHLQDLRLFVSAAARHAGCSEAAIDDLRLFASEAAAQAIDEGIAAGGIELFAGAGRDVLTLELTPAPAFGGSDGAAGPLERSPGEHRWALLSGLFPDLERVQVDGTPRLRVRVPIQGVTAS